MLGKDYLIVNVKTKEEKYIEDAISAEDAVVSAFGQPALYRHSALNTYFFDAITSDSKTYDFIAILLKKIYLVFVGENKSPVVICSSFEEAERYKEQFPDEREFRPIEKRILDDPREVRKYIPKEKKVYFLRIDKNIQLIESDERGKDVESISKLDKINLMDIDGNYCIYSLGVDIKDAYKNAVSLLTSPY